MHTYFLRLAVFWVGFSSAFCASGSNLDLLNGSRSNTLAVATFAGPCSVQPGLSLPWPVDTGGCTNYIDGTNAGTWTAADGHQYLVTLSDSGVCSVVDLSSGQTQWFWSGFAFVFAAGLLALGGRWVRMVLAPGTEVE